MDSDTLRKQRFIINAAYLAIGLALYYVFFRYVIYKVWPFAIAALIALSLNRVTNWISSKVHIPRGGISALLVFLVYAVVGTLAALLVIRLIYLAANTLTNLPAWYETNVAPSVEIVLEKYEDFMVNLNPEISGYLNDVESSILNKLMEAVTIVSRKAISLTQNIVTTLPGTLIGILIMVVASFIMSIDSVEIGDFLMAQFNDNTRHAIYEALSYVGRGVRQIILSYGLIMLLTFCELLLGLTIIGIESPGAKALPIAIFDILPVVGSGAVLIPWAIISAIKLEFGKALKLLILYIIIAVIRNSFLEPKVVGDSIGIHPILMLASIFLGATVLGPLGIVIMPFTLIVIKNLNDSGRIHLFKYAETAENTGDESAPDGEDADAPEKTNDKAQSAQKE